MSKLKGIILILIGVLLYVSPPITAIEPRNFSVMRHFSGEIINGVYVMSNDEAVLYATSIIWYVIPALIIVLGVTYLKEAKHEKT